MGPSRTQYSAAKQTFMQRCFGPDLFFFALIRLKDDSATAACTHAVKEKMRL